MLGQWTISLFDQCALGCQSKVERWFQVIIVKGLERVSSSLERLWSRDLKEVWVFRICFELISPDAHQIASYSDSLKEHIICLISKGLGKDFGLTILLSEQNIQMWPCGDRFFVLFWFKIKPFEALKFRSNNSTKWGSIH